MFGVNLINNFSNLHLQNISTFSANISTLNINQNLPGITDSLNLSSLTNMTQNINITNININILNFPFSSFSPLSLGFPHMAQHANFNQINNQMLIMLLMLMLMLMMSSMNQGQSTLNPNIMQLPNGPFMPLPLPNFGGFPSTLGFPPTNGFPTYGPQNQVEGPSFEMGFVGGGSSAIVNLALQQVGKPYVFGAAGPHCFDCSGLVYWIFKKLGRKIPRTADAQYNVGMPVSRNQLQPGDLVFFANTYTSGISHVGIYIGNGKFVHAANSRKGVIISSLTEGYWAQHYAGAKRV
ncbi:MAG: C40 family peptidase [bacterium]